MVILQSSSSSTSTSSPSLSSSLPSVISDYNNRGGGTSISINVTSSANNRVNNLNSNNKSDASRPHSIMDSARVGLDYIVENSDYTEKLASGEYFFYIYM